MARVLILSAKPILKKKEEKALSRADIQVAALSKYDEDFFKTGNEDFNVIVIDDNLRGVDTYQACRQIRALSRAIIILLGNTPSWEMWDKCRNTGFDRYYRKPLKSSELLHRIKLTLSKQGNAANSETASIIKDQGESDAHRADTEMTPVPETKASLWQNPRVTRLISYLLSGKIGQLNPVISLHLKDGFSYLEADAVLETSGINTSRILESLAGEGLLLKKEFGKILVSPGGSVQLIPVERCPSCDSAQLTRGQLIEHFGCGYIGLEEEFTQGVRQACPKCKRELKLIGTDYRKPGARYVCNACHETFPSPRIKCHCLSTGEVFDLEELHQVVLYSYRLNEAIRKRLEFELEPKKHLIEYLDYLGYEVQESVQVVGRSGVTHTIDLLASIDDPIFRHTLAIGILTTPHGGAKETIDSLFSFDGKTYDAGIDDKIVIAVPRFTSEAIKFAERQGIRIYHIEELRGLLGRLGFPQIAGNGKKQQALECRKEPDFTRTGTKGWLRWILEKKGYYVAENVMIKGRSGTEHNLDFYAQKDNGIMNHRLAIGVIENEDSSGNDINWVIQFDTAAYDAGIRDKMIISMVKLSKEARQFAEYQRIRILEAKDLAELSSKYQKLMMHPASAAQ